LIPYQLSSLWPSLLSHHSQPTSLKVDTLDPEVDGFKLNPSAPCPKINFLRQAYFQSKGFKELTSAGLYSYCRELYAEKVNNATYGAEDFFMCGDSLLSAHCASSPLPVELDDGTYEGVFQCVTQLMYLDGALRYGANSVVGVDPDYSTKAREKCRLQTSGALTEIYDKASAPEPKPLALTAAHDLSMICILTALGVYDGVWPSYAEPIILEVYEDPQHSGSAEDRMFRILRKGQPLYLPTCLNKGTKELCPLAALKEQIGPDFFSSQGLAQACQVPEDAVSASEGAFAGSPI